MKALVGSNNSQSINRKLLQYAVRNLDVEIIELGALDIPIYSQDIEREHGIPHEIMDLAKMLEKEKKVILASPEHNSLMPAFLKNILDWLSRTGIKYLINANVLIITTSPGRGGAAKSAAALANHLKHTGAIQIETFSLPSFKDNFDNGITDQEMNLELENKLKNL